MFPKSILHSHMNQTRMHQRKHHSANHENVIEKEFVRQINFDEAAEKDGQGREGEEEPDDEEEGGAFRGVGGGGEGGEDLGDVEGHFPFISLFLITFFPFRGGGGEGPVLGDFGVWCCVLFFSSLAGWLDFRVLACLLTTILLPPR